MLEPVLPKPVTGDVFIVDGVKYQVVAEEQVSFAGPDRPGSKTDIVIPATVKYNGYRFSVTEIAEKALNNETKLVRVAIGKNVERIGRNAFRNCAALKTVIIRTSRLTDASVGSNAFKGIYPKASVQVPAAKLKEYRELLSKKGLPKTAKIRTL